MIFYFHKNFLSVQFKHALRSLGLIKQHIETKYEETLHITDIEHLLYRTI